MANPSPSTAAAVSPTTATATATAQRPLVNSRPSVTSPIPQFTRQTQAQHRTQHPSLYAAAPQPIPSMRPSPQPANPRSQQHSILYPVASSGRGYLPRPQVTVANPPAAFPTRGVMPYPHLQHPVHIMSHPSLQYPHLGSAAIRGIPVAAQPKVATSASPVSNSNGYKSTRDKSKEDAIALVRQRKVRITEGASLYALCRSWLRNGYYEEPQPQYSDGIGTLPRPLPVGVGDVNMPEKREGEEEDEEQKKDESVEHLSAQGLLKRHIERSKKVRARFREERLKRIARYKTRLALLLPPQVEQFRNDAPSGNLPLET